MAISKFKSILPFCVNAVSTHFFYFLRNNILVAIIYDSKIKGLTLIIPASSLVCMDDDFNFMTFQCTHVDLQFHM